MKSSQELRARALVELIRHREHMTDEQLVGLLCASLGIETLGQKRSRAGREGGQRSAAARREASGSAQPKQTPKQDRSKPPPASEATAEAGSKQPLKQNPVSFGVATPRPLVPPTPPSGSLPPDLPKESAVVSEGSASSPRVVAPAPAATTAPKNHEEALSEPIGWVAELCVRDPMLADLLQAHRLPAVVESLTAWHEARGGQGAPKIGITSRDGDVRAMLQLFALGYLPSDVARVARYLPTTERFAAKAVASCMTKAVVEIALSELREKQPQRTAFASDLVRRVDSARGPSSLGDVLPKLAAGGLE